MKNSFVYVFIYTISHTESANVLIMALNVFNLGPLLTKTVLLIKKIP